MSKCCGDSKLNLSKFGTCRKCMISSLVNLCIFLFLFSVSSKYDWGEVTTTIFKFLVIIFIIHSAIHLIAFVKNRLNKG